eukprot:TRINITY_DN1191_c0_g1_i1.p1 TRINITY_DN1191_c0_g1~~TRINITY_DN1191_c0_g1_i1.p1  ORF type:complete len:224 (+),score=19.32 TRINITY_DN1191_c0_g1_i1:100-672(+)
MSVVYGRKDLPPSGPTIDSCQFKLNGHTVDFTLQFNTDMMNPTGIQNGSQYQLYVTTSPYKDPMPYSTLQLLFNDTWVPAFFDNAHAEDSQAGRVLFHYELNGASDMPTEIRYAWIEGQGGCCPGQLADRLPCPPRSCPIMQKFNTTYDPKNEQVGLEMGLPANPFWAKLIWDPTSKTGKCQCFEPQICG